MHVTDKGFARAVSDMGRLKRFIHSAHFMNDLGQKPDREHRSLFQELDKVGWVDLADDARRCAADARRTGLPRDGGEFAETVDGVQVRKRNKAAVFIFVPKDFRTTVGQNEHTVRLTDGAIDEQVI